MDISTNHLCRFYLLLPATILARRKVFHIGALCSSAPIESGYADAS